MEPLFITEPGPTTATTEWLDQCARCGSSLYWEDCPTCEACGRGYADDPDPTCSTCAGSGRTSFCLSGYEWCQAHPLPGRESVACHTAEWFEVRPC
jgi:hypothetical protein